MFLLGLLLILAAAAVTVGVVYDGGEAAEVEILGRTLDTEIWGVFFTGMGTMLVLLLGLWMLYASMGRARRKRSERKETRNRHRDSVTRLEEERTALRAENEKLNEELSSRRGTSPGAGGAASAGGGTATQERVATDRGQIATPHADEHHESRAIRHDGGDPPGTRTGDPESGRTTEGRHRESL